MKNSSNQNFEKVRPYRNLRLLILLILTLGIVIAFLYYLYINAEKFLELINISSKGVVSLAIITLISMVVNGLIITLLFRGLDALVSPQDGFLLAAASTLANQLPISGGMISRGYYLKQIHNLSYTKFISASLALFVCFVSVNGLIGILVLLYWWVLKGKITSPYLWFGFIAMAASVLLFWLPLYRMKIPARLRIWVVQAVDGWMILGKNPITGLKLIALQTTMMILLAVRYWLSFRMLSQDVSIGDVILFSSAAVLTQLISIAPGGLGITESIVGAVASALGFDLGVSVVAVSLDRLIATAVVLIIGGISTFLLGNKLLARPQNPEA